MSCLIASCLLLSLIMPDFGHWLRHLREDAREPLRLTAAAIGVDSTLLSKFERNDRLPTISQVKALAEHFNIDGSEMESRWLAAKIFTQYGKSAVLRGALIRILDITAPAPNTHK